MPQNSLYPGFVKLKYSSNSHNHHQILPIQLESWDAGAEPVFFLRNMVSTINMNDAVDAYVALIDNLFNTTDSFVLAEFWVIETPESDPIFAYAYEIGAAGVAVAADVPNSQLVISFRTALGGILKLYFMEQGIATNIKDDYPFTNSTIAAIASYLTASATGWVCGRDGSFPISPLRALTKVNDALRKKYVLNN